MKGFHDRSSEINFSRIDRSFGGDGLGIFDVEFIENSAKSSSLLLVQNLERALDFSRIAKTLKVIFIF